MKHAQHTPATPRGKHRGIPLQLTATLALASLMALNACQQDMPTDNGTLPDGRYPVLIKAAVPQTRVVDDGWTTTWEDGDTISVGQAGVPDKIGRYVLNQDGTVKRIIDTLYYDLTKEFIAIKAWYPATETYGTFIVDYAVDNPVSLMDAGTIVQDYFHPVTLEFRHKDSKLRVQIEGDTEGAVYKVEVDAISQSTFNPSDDVVSTLGSDTKRMRLHPKGNNVWEGYVGNGSQISCVYVNGEEVPLEETLKPKMGQMCTVTVNVNYKEHYEKIVLDTLTNTYRITEGGTYHFTGTNNRKYYIPIIVEAPATLLLDNVTLDTYAEHAIYITATGTTTIKVNGYNRIEILYGNKNGVGAITLDGADTHLLLEGPGTLRAVSDTHAAIGTPYKKEGQAACGDITIKNVTLELRMIQGKNYKNSADIGTGYCEAKGSQTHGNITIANSTISSISGSKDEAYRIGSTIDEALRSPDNGEINIYLKEGETEDNFLNRITDTKYKVDPRAQFHPYEETLDWLK